MKWSLGRQHTAAGSLTYTNCRVKCRFCTFHQWNSPVRLCTGWPAVPMKLHPPRVGLGASPALLIVRSSPLYRWGFSCWPRGPFTFR